MTFCSDADIAKSITSGSWGVVDRDIPEAILYGLQKEVRSSPWRMVRQLPVHRENELGGQLCAFLRGP